MSKNPKEKKNLVHAPPAWAIVNCPNSWIARTRRPARINFALTKFANVTGMFGKPLPGQRKQNRHQSSSAFHLWINFWENAGKAEKGFSKDTARYLGWWKWYLGCKCYLRDGNVIFLLLVQMRKCRWTAWRQRKNRQRRPWAWESRYDGRWGNQTFLKWMMTTKKYL